jgi:flagellin
MRKRPYLKPFMILALCSLAAKAQTGIEWTWRNPLPHGESVTGAVWTGSQIVAVGMQNSIRTSPDGRAWTQRDLRYYELLGTTLDAVAWTGTKLVGVGGFGRISTSPDGTVWTEQSSSVLKDFRAVCWTGTRLVAVGDRGVILTSPDGTAWTLQTSGTTAALYSAAWTGSRIVVGGNYVSLASPDGVAWSLNEDVPGSLESLLWTGTRLIATGFPDLISTSPDGETWTAADLELSGAHFDCLVKTGTEIMAFGENGDAAVRAPESVFRDEIRFSTRGLTAGIYILKAEWAGRTYARTVALAP